MAHSQPNTTGLEIEWPHYRFEYYTPPSIPGMSARGGAECIAPPCLLFLRNGMDKRPEHLNLLQALDRHLPWGP